MGVMPTPPAISTIPLASAPVKKKFARRSSDFKQIAGFCVIVEVSRFKAVLFALHRQFDVLPLRRCRGDRVGAPDLLTVDFGGDRGVLTGQEHERERGLDWPPSTERFLTVGVSSKIALILSTPFPRPLYAREVRKAEERRLDRQAAHSPRPLFVCYRHSE